MRERLEQERLPAAKRLLQALRRQEEVSAIVPMGVFLDRLGRPAKQVPRLASRPDLLLQGVMVVHVVVALAAVLAWTAVQTQKAILVFAEAAARSSSILPGKAFI